MAKELTLAMELVRRLNKLVRGPEREKAKDTIEQLLHMSSVPAHPALFADEEPLVLSTENYLSIMGLFNGMLGVDGVHHIRIASCWDGERHQTLTGFGLWVNGKFVEGSDQG